jgi:hypothetical protein
MKLLRIYLLLTFFLITTQLLPKENYLKDKFLLSEKGDYIVTDQNDLYTLLHVREITPHQLVLEEISIPKKQFSSLHLTWREWVNNKSPNNTSWNIFEIDIKNNKVLEIYSFSENGFLHVDSDNFLLKLLNMPITLLEQKDRRKVGPRPYVDEIDRRTPWSPSITINGTYYEKTNCDVYQIAWPKDGSHLSNKVLDLYFDNTHGIALPFYIQINNSYLSIIYKTVDCGKNLISPIESYPHMPPQFLPDIYFEDEDTIDIAMSFSRHYQQFNLYAIATNKTSNASVNKKFLPLPHATKIDNGLIVLTLSKNEMKDILPPNRSYYFVAIPITDCPSSSFYIEMPHPYFFKKI